MAYDSQLLLELLTVSAWKSESSLEFSGFLKLADKIDSKIRHQGGEANLYVPDQKYLGRLLTDLIKNINAGLQTGRNSKYIQNILNYLDFPDWETFTKTYLNAQTCIDLTKVDASRFEQTNITILTADNALKTVQDNLSYAENGIKIPIKYKGSKAQNRTDLLKELQVLADSSIYVIWGISDEWNELLKPLKKTKEFTTLLNNGQILPVRTGETLEAPCKRFSFNAALKPLCGKVGFLMALAIVQQAENGTVGNQETKTIKQNSRLNIGKFINNGTVNTGDLSQENHGGNNVSGGNIIQHFHSKEDE